LACRNLAEKGDGDLLDAPQAIEGLVTAHGAEDVKKRVDLLR
jgi:hypothetical protein